MTAATSGQADEIPDAFARHISLQFPPEVLFNAPNEITGRWKHMTSPAERKFWHEVDAAIAAQQPQPAPEPELAAAMAILRRVLQWLEPAGTGYRVNVTRAQVAHAWLDGGLLVPEELRRFL